MSGKFIDTNVFVYLFDETAPAKRSVAEALIFDALNDGSASISFQVVQETLSVVTRKLKSPMSPAEARDFLQKILVPLWRVMPNQMLYSRSIDLQARYGFSFYDALIIAAALDSGCSVLYSEDMQHGQKIDDLTIRNPFAA